MIPSPLERGKSSRDGRAARRGGFREGYMAARKRRTPQKGAKSVRPQSKKAATKGGRTTIQLSKKRLSAKAISEMAANTLAAGAAGAPPRGKSTRAVKA